MNTNYVQSARYFTINLGHRVFDGENKDDPKPFLRKPVPVRFVRTRRAKPS